MKLNAHGNQCCERDQNIFPAEPRLLFVKKSSCFTLPCAAPPGLVFHYPTYFIISVTRETWAIDWTLF